MSNNVNKTVVNTNDFRTWGAFHTIKNAAYHGDLCNIHGTRSLIKGWGGGGPRGGPNPTTTTSTTTTAATAAAAAAAATYH